MRDTQRENDRKLGNDECGEKRMIHRDREKDYSKKGIEHVTFSG